MKKLKHGASQSAESPSRLIDARITKLGDWRGETLCLEGHVRRAIDLHEGEKVNASAFKALIREAVALNKSSRRS